MDVLVMLEDHPAHSPVLAHVNSVPEPLDSGGPSRDIVTLYGDPSVESVALALAAAVEGHRAGWGDTEVREGEGVEKGEGVAAGRLDVIRHLGVWPERGAVGDAAWHDSSGKLVTRDLEIPLDILRATAAQLLAECGEVIRRVVTGLGMPGGPDGVRRAVPVSLGPVAGLTTPVFKPLESLLEKW